MCIFNVEIIDFPYFLFSTDSSYTLLYINVMSNIHKQRAALHGRGIVAMIMSAKIALSDNFRYIPKHKEWLSDVMKKY